MEKLTQVAKKAHVQKLIDTDNRAVARALVRIYQRQTDSEQRSGETRFTNSVGFNSSDANYMTYCATYVLNGGELDGEHLEKVRAKIRRYWRQLIEIAEEQQTLRMAMGKPVASKYWGAQAA